MIPMSTRIMAGAAKSLGDAPMFDAGGWAIQTSTRWRTFKHT